MLIMIAAMDQQQGIGLDGRLPWHIPEDLALFRASTLHHIVLMGRTTYERLPGKLKDRRIAVCSRDPEFMPDDPDVTVVRDLNAYLDCHEADAEEIYVCGGAAVYRQAYPYCRRANISLVRDRYPADAVLDCFRWADWRITSEVYYGRFTYRTAVRREGKEEAR